MPKLKEKTKVEPSLKLKEKTSVYSTKVIIGISLFSLVAFVIIIAFGKAIFRNISFTAENSSNFQFVEREKLGADPLITMVSYKPSLKDTDPIRGFKEAPLTIVEFGDFECSFSATMENTIKDVLKAYPQEIRLVWKDLPLTSVHSQAYEAAIASRCAQDQGKFWEMHDLLLENNLFLYRNRYSELAKELELNLEEFDQCVDQKKTASLVEDGMKQAQDLKIDRTPHFFINDQEISGTASFEDFKKLIEIELEP